MAGMHRAMINPKRPTCQDSTLTPAVKVPSASNVKTASPVALALKRNLHARQQQHVHQQKEGKPVQHLRADEP